MDYSGRIAGRILASREYRDAGTIMIYKGVRGEVRLDLLEEDAKARNKKLVYPFCVDKTTMTALFPSESAWKKGSFGIPEPVLEKAEEIMPEEIDLVICPCTVFDAAGSRIGMGAGYYDRFLTKCTNAHIVAVAFEVQKTEYVPLSSWDQRMEKIYTEAHVYPAKS